MPKQDVLPELLHIFIPVIDRDIKIHINGIYRLAILLQDTNLVFRTCCNIINIQKTVCFGIPPLRYFKNAVPGYPGKSHRLL